MDKILASLSSDLTGLRATTTAQKPAEPVTEAAELKPQQQAEPATETDLADAVQQINEFIQIARRDLVFSVDESTGTTVVTVVDAQTQEVIRQIPSEEVLAIAARLDEARGLLFESKA